MNALGQFAVSALVAATLDLVLSGIIFDMSGKQLAIVGGKHFAALGPDLDSWLVQGT